MMIRGFFFSLLLTVFFTTGCSQQSYPGDKLKHSLQEICKKEYGIDNIDVKVVGNTIGVYLPLEELFSTELKENLAKGNLKAVGNLFEPSPEALDKVEDVLFSISRVLLSTDRKLDFYILQATDVEGTGLQLVLKGNVDDIKRVRIWDISRSEYRKRVVHELKLNPTVVWHKPIRNFFNDLSRLRVPEVAQKYFDSSVPSETIQRLFLDILSPTAPITDGTDVSWKVLETRSTELNQLSAVVYARVQPSLEAAIFDEEDLEYLFILTHKERRVVVTRVIPFQYFDSQGRLSKIDFPKELQIGENLSKWNEEFTVTPIDLGVFLAQQVTRRVQSQLIEDERIRNTIREAKINFVYNENEEIDESAYFSMEVDAQLREKDYFDVESALSHEDMHYLLALASREFLSVLRGYGFQGYKHLQLEMTQDPRPVILGRENLELFRKNKMDFKTLLSSFF